MPPVIRFKVMFGKVTILTVVISVMESRLVSSWSDSGGNSPAWQRKLPAHYVPRCLTGLVS